MSKRQALISYFSTLTTPKMAREIAKRQIRQDSKIRGRQWDPVWGTRRA